MLHVDDFIESISTSETSEGENYAKFFFLLKRLPAFMQYSFKQYIDQYQLYCDYQGRTYRVTGASRMGDIWLQSDMKADTGYVVRADLAKCSNFIKELG